MGTSFQARSQGHFHDPIRLEILKHLFSAIAEEMGVVLRKTSYSPNIKERRDFSCALFDASGDMVAQAAHIPVHLGSMPLSVAAAVNRFPPGSQNELRPGDIIILNDPYLGGTHLPDITMVAPVYAPFPLAGNEEHLRLVGFTACRAHHADVGGITPGSMPLARELYQEGLVIPPVKLFESNQICQGIFDMILANVRTPQERAGDLWAQIAALRRGEARLVGMAARYGIEQIAGSMQALIDYTERMTRRLLQDLPDGQYTFEDELDDAGFIPVDASLPEVESDSHSAGPEQAKVGLPIKVTITILDDHALIDFTGTAVQQKSSINAVYAITLSAVYYVFRCLLGIDVPNNSGCLRPIEVIAPESSLVNARHPAPVAGGNVETSQRIVDVLFGALAGAVPLRIPAASQGTMNNVTIGGENHGKPFTYYETIGGGMGARKGADGASAIHSHMTNTLNTPVEALEYAYPLRVQCYEVWRGSGGNGCWRGGDGIRRDIQVLADAQVTILSERRRTRPYGLEGGEPGQSGVNICIREGKQIFLPGKGSFEFHAGDILSIRTPGGGGFGYQGSPDCSPTRGE